ncbi:17612_t:CDS:2 [Rhizophagus irregularis]|nr:17612_t:CDS:2 [Rhizophagus irregularis]
MFYEIKDDNDDNNNIFNEVEDPRYNTQTYKFSLDDLNKAYNDLINNRLRLLDIS